MKKYVDYIIVFILCSAITVGVIFLRGLLKVTDTAGVMSCLSDGFFVAGIFALACGGLAFAGSRGILDAFTYTVRKMWVYLHDKKYRDSHKMSYEQYKEKKAEKSRPFAHFFIVGGIFTAVGILFTILYYCLR